MVTDPNWLIKLAFRRRRATGVAKRCGGQGSGGVICTGSELRELAFQVFKMVPLAAIAAHDDHRR